MKRIILTILIIAISLCKLMAQNEAMYVYRNDGGFDAFLKSDIDSIVYSHYDNNRVYHSDWQMQEVHTSDSIFRIPLAVIDSVSFIAPPTIVNKAVFELTAAHDAYLSTCDTIRFTLALSTPKDMQPLKGNIVVSTYDCNSFPDGIMARVVSKTQDNNGIHYECEHVGLDAVYDQLVFIGNGYIDNEKINQIDTKMTRMTFGKELWNKTWSSTLEKGGTTTNFSINDAAHIVVTVNIQPNKPIFFRMDLQNNLNSTFTFNATSSFERWYEKQIVNVKLGKIRIPQCPLLFITPKFTLSGYFAEGGTVSLDFKGHYNRTDKVSYTYQDNAWSVSHAPTNDAGVDVASLSMNGYAEIGVIPDLLFSFCGSATGIGLEYSIGIKETADFKFDAVAAYDEGMYAALKDCYARTTLPQNVRTYAQLGLFGEGVQPLNYNRSLEPKLGSDKYLLPLFTKPEYTQGSKANSAVLKSDISRDLLLPVEVGMVYYDHDIKQKSVYMSTPYKTNKEWSLKGMQTVFTDMQPGKTYTVFHIVKLMGKELRAQPSTIFPEYHACPDSNHPHAIDLGLPSGTKWACCNVGATSPDESGGYYAWGETSEKDVYNTKSYAYQDNTGTYINIGTDIVDSQYDVAHILMGGTWHMPSYEQISELLSNCTFEYTNKNGIKGMLVTGSNGGQFFLPAAFGRGDDNLDDILSESGGYYWSGTLSTKYDQTAYIFSFASYHPCGIYRCNRGQGISVRAVCQ